MKLTKTEMYPALKFGTFSRIFSCTFLQSFHLTSQSGEQ